MYGAGSRVKFSAARPLGGPTVVVIRYYALKALRFFAMMLFSRGWLFEASRVGDYLCSGSVVCDLDFVGLVLMGARNKRHEQSS